MVYAQVRGLVVSSRFGAASSKILEASFAWPGILLRAAVAPTAQSARPCESSEPSVSSHVRSYDLKFLNLLLRGLSEWATKERYLD